MVSGLARAAEKSGAQIFENVPVEEIEFTDPVRLRFSGGEIRARKVLLATNGMSLELSDLAGRGQTKFTLAVATEPLGAAQLESLGLASEKPFYTVDFPYLWGRILRTGGVIFGGGLVHMNDWRELVDLDIEAGQAGGADRAARIPRPRAAPGVAKCALHERVGRPDPDRKRMASGLRAASPEVRTRSCSGAFSGHGVAQSVYLGRWAAEVLCGKQIAAGLEFVGPELQPVSVLILRCT